MLDFHAKIVLFVLFSLNLQPELGLFMKEVKIQNILGDFLREYYVKAILMGLCLFSVLACGNMNSDKEQKEAESVKTSVGKGRKPLIIQIYCYGNAVKSKATWMKQELEKSYSSVELVDRPLTLPNVCFNKERNRYDGSGLLRDLSRLKKETAVLGVTDKVIFKANELSPTYGIFGLSPVGAHVAIISTTMPSGKKLADDHLVKLMLHELGHAFGLKHCSNEHCFMVDAEHGNKFARTPSFCNSCRHYLNTKGWRL